MFSFFKKLKKDIGIEEENKKEDKEKAVEEKPKKEIGDKKVHLTKVSLSEEEEKSGKEKERGKGKGKEKGKGKPSKRSSLENSGEGELAVDLCQSKDDLFVRSVIAGVKPEDLEILIEDDVIMIRGQRKEPEEEGIEYLSRECYFGPFSRRVISPFEIDGSRAKATMKNGILVIRIPKIEREKKVKLKVERE